MPVSRSWIRLILTMLFLLSEAGAVRGEPAPQLDKVVPVLFVPWKVDPSFTRMEKVLRELLSARMISTGQFAETVTAETEQELGKCVREVNREATAETCWIRLGQGKGAEMMVAGEIKGNLKSCSLLVRLTLLETRVSPRKYVQLLKPCEQETLVQEIEQAAAVLAGQPKGRPAEPPLPGGETVQPAPPPPAVPSAGPVIQGGVVTQALGSLTVEAKPFGQVRLELTDPSGKVVVSGSPYRNASATSGSWQIHARAQGFAEEAQSAVVLPDETTLVKFELKLLGGLEITGQPAGAAVEVSGPGGFSDRRGLPWSAKGLASGSYRVSVRREGYEPFSTDAVVRPGETARVQVQLRRPEAPPPEPSSPPPTEPSSNGFPWISLPGGSFDMGSSKGESDEQPVHHVRIPAFHILKHEVTRGQYASCVQAGICQLPARQEGCSWQTSQPELPINCVTWQQAQDFVRWIRTQGWPSSRLCREAEWEYAARSGGRDIVFPWGDQPATCERVVMDHGGPGCGQKGIAPVCSKPAGNSAQGVCDLMGNVREWTEDNYHGSYQGAPEDGSAWLGGNSERVLRGGYWGNAGAFIRASYRYKRAPENVDNGIGFRVCR